MISPLGTVIMRFDAGLDAATTSLTGLVSQQVPGLLAIGMVGLFAVQGVQVAKGDSRPLEDLVPLMVRFGLVFWLITDPATYLYIVRDVILTWVPTTFIAAITGTLGSDVSTPVGMSAVMNGLYAQAWGASAQVGQTFSGDPLGWTQSMASFFIACWMVGGLVWVTFVYLCCQFFKTLIVIIGTLLIAAWPIPIIKHLAIGWKGLVISLVLTEILTFIAIQETLLGVQPLMATMTNALITALTQPAAAQDAMADLVAIGILLWIAALIVGAVPVSMYFLGRGGPAPAPSNPVRA